MTYDDLLQEADSNNIEIIDFTFDSNCKAMCVDNVIAMSVKLKTIKEKRCVLAEELGHQFTSTGNIIDLKSVCNWKQELKARKWSYERLVPLKTLISASYDGCTNLYELAEYLDVTEEFLKDTLQYYQNKYGLYAEVEDYAIYFSPLTVCKYNYE